MFIEADALRIGHASINKQTETPSLRGWRFFVVIDLLVEQLLSFDINRLAFLSSLPFAPYGLEVILYPAKREVNHEANTMGCLHNFIDVQCFDCPRKKRQTGDQ